MALSVMSYDSTFKHRLTNTEVTAYPGSVKP